MTNRLWFIAALLIGVALGAHAQTKKELVAKLLQVQQSGIENVGRAIAGQLAQGAMQSAGAALPRVPADKREAVGRDIQADIRKFYDEVDPLLRERAAKLAPSLAPMLEERLSEDELKQVIAWLESPVSKKFMQIDSEMGRALAERVVADTRPAIEPKLKALEAAIAGRLGVKPASAAASGASAPAKKR